MMKRFWSMLAVQLGKRAGTVAVIGLAITLVLGVGITQLRFATGQDSYLNESDQVAKDNVAYQDLFGGQIMVVLFSMQEGHDVTELVEPANRAVIEEAAASLASSPEVATVLTPIDTLRFSESILSFSPETAEKVGAAVQAAAPTSVEEYQEAHEAAVAALPEAERFNPLASIGKVTLDAAEHADQARVDDASLSADERKAAEASLAVRKADLVATTDRVLPFLSDPDGNPRSLDNPAWVDVLLHDNNGDVRKPLQSSFFDDQHAQIIVRLVGNADIETEGAGADAVKDAFEDLEIEGAEVTVTGAPVLLKDINDYLRGGILKLGGLAVAIMVVILLVFFQVRWRLLPLAVVLVGVVWAFGLAGYFGIPLSVVTIAGLPVMLGVGIDYAIQMHARVEEEVVIDRADHPIQETARQLGPALLVVTFDALFAFAALRFAKVPMIRDFALLLCIGVAVICLCSIFMTLAALGVREFRSPTTGRDFREGALGRFVVWLGALPAKTAPVLMAASVIVFAGGLAVEGRLVLQTDPVQWVNQSSQNRKDVATLEAETNASSELGIYVTAPSSDDLFDQQTLNWLEHFTTDSLTRYCDQLLVGSSILSPVADLTDLTVTDPNVAGDAAKTTNDHDTCTRALTEQLANDASQDFVPDPAIVKAAYAVAPRSVRELTVSQTSDKAAFNVLFISKPGDLAKRATMIDEMRERLHTTNTATNTRDTNSITPPQGIDATPSGLAVVGVGLLENLEANRVQLTYLSIGLVFAFLTIRLKSIVRSLLSLVPVLIAVGAASLIAYALDLKLSPMTAVGGPLVIAVCTEFTSLILLRFIEERERGLAPQTAADITASRTGRAFIVSAMTAIVGVGVIATSTLPLLRDFGIIVAMNVLVALASALIILPPVMVWAEQRGWVTRGMVDPDKLGNKTTDFQGNTPDLT